jgi:hypothetical protein
MFPRKKVIVTADRHSTSFTTIVVIKANLGGFLSVPYGALQGLIELLHSRCFRAGTDAADNPGIRYVRSGFG